MSISLNLLPILNYAINVKFLIIYCLLCDMVITIFVLLGILPGNGKY